MKSLNQIIDGLICCAFISPASCGRCPYQPEAPDGCYQLKTDAETLKEAVAGMEVGNRDGCCNQSEGNPDADQKD